MLIHFFQLVEWDLYHVGPLSRVTVYRLSVMFFRIFFSRFYLNFIVFWMIVVHKILMFGILFVFCTDMWVVSFCERFLIVLVLWCLFISLSDETSIWFAERLDWRGLFVIGFDSDSTTIVVIWVLFELEGVFELTGWRCVLVFDVGFGFAVTEKDLFTEGIRVLFEVFNGVFHLI